MLKLGEKVSGGYQIASLPFDSKEAAEKWIKEYWSKEKSKVKAVYSSHDGKWYIASR